MQCSFPNLGLAEGVPVWVGDVYKLETRGPGR